MEVGGVERGGRGVGPTGVPEGGRPEGSAPNSKAPRGVPEVESPRQLGQTASCQLAPLGAHLPQTQEAPGTPLWLCVLGRHPTRAVDDEPKSIPGGTLGDTPTARTRAPLPLAPSASPLGLRLRLPLRDCRCDCACDCACDCECERAPCLPLAAPSVGYQRRPSPCYGGRRTYLSAAAAAAGSAPPAPTTFCSSMRPLQVLSPAPRWGSCAASAPPAARGASFCPTFSLHAEGLRQGYTLRPAGQTIQDTGHSPRDYGFQESNHRILLGLCTSKLLMETSYWTSISACGGPPGSGVYSSGLQNKRFKTQDTKHRTQNTGHKTQDSGYRTQGLRAQDTVQGPFSHSALEVTHSGEQMQGRDVHKACG